MGTLDEYDSPAGLGFYFRSTQFEDQVILGFTNDENIEGWGNVFTLNKISNSLSYYSGRLKNKFYKYGVIVDEKGP